MKRNLWVGAAFIALLGALAVGSIVLGKRAVVQAASVMAPRFEVDPLWPKPLPNHWLLGQTIGVSVDAQDHIWIIHRAGSLEPGERHATTTPPIAQCCAPAPPVLEYDQAGNLLRHWGGPGQGYNWPDSNHGITIDYKGNVWIGGNGRGPQPAAGRGRGPAAEDNEGQTGDAFQSFADNMVLKFTQDGKFLMQIGKPSSSKGSNDIDNLRLPAKTFVDSKTNELYVADGYKNRRVIVFDADTGAYKRHWGAYGKRPADGPQHGSPSGPPVEDPSTFSQQFRLVHCVVQSKDGLLYVCDRRNNRIQVFRTDGTFVKEGLIAPQSLGFGAVHTIAFSPDREQRFLYVADGANKKVWTLRREDLAILGSFGHGGRAGGEFILAHAIATDSHGNIYLGESIGNGRVQRFKFVGMRSSTSH
jgi:DNA-binding beta-propeller fold protein YncE